MKHVFLFDPKSFYNQQWKMDNILDHISEFFRTQEKPDFSVRFSRFRRDSIGIINDELGKAKEGGVIRVYAIGGEEILFDCLNAVALFPNMELAVVPHGESADFLHIFGEGKAELFRDIPSLVQSDSISADVIKWGVNYALNSCYIGLNSAMSKKVKDMKASFNKVSYFLFSKMAAFINRIQTVFNREIAAQKYYITIDDQDYTANYSLIHIANGPYHNGKKTGASNAVPDDGLLDIALIKAAGPFKTMASMRKYSKGKCPKNCILLQGKKVHIMSDRQMWIQMDNEYIQDTNINLSVIPMAVQIVSAGNLPYQKPVLKSKEG